MPTNTDRAAWAEAAVLSFCAQVRNDKQPDLYDPLSLVLSDLLTDLMHLADRGNVHFPSVLKRAATHYQKER